MTVEVLFLAANTFSSLQHKAIVNNKTFEGVWMLSEVNVISFFSQSHNSVFFTNSISQLAIVQTINYKPRWIKPVSSWISSKEVSQKAT